MSGIGRFKLSDAVAKTTPSTSKKEAANARGKAKDPAAVASEQAREIMEAAQAKDAESSIRGHMVDIGRGNQQAGRQGGGRRGK